MGELSREQISILRHTSERAAGGRYCGDSPDMQRLVQLGLMHSIGKPSWCPDEFFVLTGAGRKTLQELRTKEPTHAD